MGIELSWTHGGAESAFVLAGVVTESAEYDGLLEALGPRNVLDAGGLKNFNSSGVREWITFIQRAAGQGKVLDFVNCSTSFVGQLNMIGNFIDKMRVLSIQAPYFCPACERCDHRLFDVTSDVTAQLAAPFKCTACGGEMEFDDLPELYFAFMTKRPA